LVFELLMPIIAVLLLMMNANIDEFNKPNGQSYLDKPIPFSPLEANAAKPFPQNHKDQLTDMKAALKDEFSRFMK